jgi:hypothetical protein
MYKLDFMGKRGTHFFKTTALALAFFMVASDFAGIAHAAGGLDPAAGIDPEALRVSEAYTARHPRGVAEVESPLVYTAEGREFDYLILRRGGTEGEVSVDIKAIETIAKYGEDFTVSVKGENGGFREIKKTDDSPTMLEEHILKSEGEYFSGDYRDPALQDYETVSVSTVEELEALLGPDAVVPGTETADETIEEEIIEEETPEEIAYESPLHKMRDEATGVATPSDAEAAAQSDIREINDPDQIAANNEVIKLLPGPSATLTFADGENYKHLRVNIKNDSEYEAQEFFMLALYNPEGGIELGDTMLAEVYIDNTDPVKLSRLSFDPADLTVSADDGFAYTSIRRSGALGDYIGIQVQTVAGSAKPGTDYYPVTGEFLFLPGETVKHIAVPLLTGGRALDGELSMGIQAQTEDNAEFDIPKANITILPAAGTEEPLPIIEETPQNPQETAEEPTVGFPDGPGETETPANEPADGPGGTETPADEAADKPGGTEEPSDDPADKPGGTESPAAPGTDAGTDGTDGTDGPDGTPPAQEAAESPESPENTGSPESGAPPPEYRGAVRETPGA